MKKCVITVVGNDTVGIIAKVCTYLADNGINILDMMMIVDISNAKTDFEDMNKSLESLGQDIGVTVKCQREEIFDMMHRI